MISYFHPLFHQFIPVISIGILLAVKQMGFNVQQAAKEFIRFKAYETMGQLLSIQIKDGEFLFYNQSRRGGGINSIVSTFKDLDNIKVKGKVVALLGSMSIKEDEENTYILHKDTADLVNKSAISHLYTTGVHMDIVYENLTDASIFIKHSDDYQLLLEDLLNDIELGDLLLIKGHASLNLARLAKMILNHQKTSHQYTINLGWITL